MIESRAREIDAKLEGICGKVETLRFDLRGASRVGAIRSLIEIQGLILIEIQELAEVYGEVEG